MIENKYYILTLGCQMNISDSQRIATKLEELGYKSAPEKDADLVVVNACSVRQKAVDRIWGGIKKWQKDGKEILITGCVLPADKKKFFNRGITVLDIEEYYDFPMKLSGKIAYIPIMTGCDNFCSYCAVPLTRGREVSRPMDDILKEVKDAIKKGFREIWLLGQNVNSYKYGFAKLLKKIDNLDGDFKFNFVSSNPHDMTDEIINTFAGLKKWTQELHLAMQSGDDEILRKMNRKYTSGQFLALTSKIKVKISKLKLSTDIIVGFPTETKEQFKNTVKIVKKIGFVKAYISQYSPRLGTASAKMPDNVPAAEKKRRWLKLDHLINR